MIINKKIGNGKFVKFGVVLTFFMFLAGLGAAEKTSFSSVVEDTGLTYSFTDTIQEFDEEEGEWRNTYYIEVVDTDLEKIGDDHYDVRVDVELTEVGEILSGPPGQMEYEEAAKELNDKGYRVNGGDWTAEDARYFREEELDELELTVEKSSGYSVRNVPKGLAVNPDDTFTVGMDLKGVGGDRPLRSAFRLGGGSVEFALVETLTGASDGVEGVDFDETNGFLAVGSSDSNVYVYDTADFTLVETLTDAADDVWSIDFDETNGYLAAGSFDGNAYVYDTTDFTLAETLSVDDDRAYSVSFDESNGYLAVGTGFTNYLVEIYDTTDFTLVETLTDATNPVAAADFDESNRYLAVGSFDDNTYVYDTTDFTLVETLTDATSNVEGVDFDETNGFLAAGSRDSNVYVYDTADFTLVETLTDAADDVWSIDFDETNGYLATGSDDNNVYVYHTTDFTLVETLTDATSNVKGVDFDETNDYLAAGSGDENTYVYDTSTEPEINNLDLANPTTPIYSETSDITAETTDAQQVEIKITQDQETILETNLSETTSQNWEQTNALTINKVNSPYNITATATNDGGTTTASMTYIVEYNENTVETSTDFTSGEQTTLFGENDLTTEQNWVWGLKAETTEEGTFYSNQNLFETLEEEIIFNLNKPNDGETFNVLPGETREITFEGTVETQTNREGQITILRNNTILETFNHEGGQNTVTTNEQLGEGTYNYKIRFEDTDGTTTDSTTNSFTIEESEIDTNIIFDLGLPSDNAELGMTTQTFTGTAEALEENVETAEIELVDPDQNRFTVDTGGGEQLVSLEGSYNLDKTGEWEWKINAQHQFSDDTQTSETRTFTVTEFIAEINFNLVKPENESFVTIEDNETVEFEAEITPENFELETASLTLEKPDNTTETFAVENNIMEGETRTLKDTQLIEQLGDYTWYAEGTDTEGNTFTSSKNTFEGTTDTEEQRALRPLTDRLASLWDGLTEELGETGQAFLAIILIGLFAGLGLALAGSYGAMITGTAGFLVTILVGLLPGWILGLVLAFLAVMFIFNRSGGG